MGNGSVRVDNMYLVTIYNSGVLMWLFFAVIFAKGVDYTLKKKEASVIVGIIVYLMYFMTESLVEVNDIMLYFLSAFWLYDGQKQKQPGA